MHRTCTSSPQQRQNSQSELVESLRRRLVLRHSEDIESNGFGKGTALTWCESDTFIPDSVKGYESQTFDSPTVTVSPCSTRKAGEQWAARFLCLFS